MSGVLPMDFKAKRFERRWGHQPDAWKEGYYAWGPTEGKGNCPYPEGTEDHKEWQDGFGWAAYDHDEDRSK